MRKIGSLQVLEGQQFPHEQDADYVGLLFHGFGADAYDLQSLSDVFKTKKRVHWMFPQGILSVPIGPGWSGRAWWQIDINRIQKAIADGKDFDLRSEIPATLPNVRKMVFEMIEQLKIPWSRVILGGFSQGAMLSTDVFLHAPENPAALIALSGAPINYNEWKSQVQNRQGCPFFQSHGRYDDILPYRGASQLEGLLLSGGMKGSLSSFEGGHEIPMEIIVKLNQFLNTI